MKRKITELEKIRRSKLSIYKEMGVNPFSKKIDFKDNSLSLEKKYGSFSKEELQEKKEKSSLIFRIMTKRGPFIVGKDSKGNAQAYFGKDLSQKFLDLKDTFDIGDIIRVEGEVMKTNTGQLTIRAENIDLITKSLKPLPEKFHGLKDVEERYRRRYLDLLMNEDAKRTFWKRSRIISGIREFMDKLGYMEVDTPVLSPILGGAAAKPFTTHHNALDMDFYLRIATELPLKRLLVGGIDRVYEIGRIFRNEGIDTTHNPEFTSIEFYEAFSNLEGMMKRTEEIFSFISKKLKKEKIIYNEKEINFKTPFKRINMVDSVSEKVGINMRECSLEKALEIAKFYNIKIEKYYKLGHIINELFEELIESEIIQPTFVFGHPIEVSPLAAKNSEDPRFTDRAELFIDGREYANMFTELNDPIDQLERFESQIDEAKSGNDEANEVDYDFVEALEYGMPPSGGCGIGIDRMVMLFTNQNSIREVLLFPHLKNRKNPGEENE